MTFSEAEKQSSCKRERMLWKQAKQNIAMEGYNWNCKSSFVFGCFSLNYCLKSDDNRKMKVNKDDADNDDDDETWPK